MASKLLERLRRSLFRDGDGVCADSEAAEDFPESSELEDDSECVSERLGGTLCFSGSGVETEEGGAEGSADSDSDFLGESVDEGFSSTDASPVGTSPAGPSLLSRQQQDGWSSLQGQGGHSLQGQGGQEGWSSLQGQGGQQEEGRRSLQGQGGQQEEGRRSLQGQGGQQEEGRRSLQGQGGQQEEGRRSLQGQGGQQEEGRRSLQGQGGQQEEGRRSLQGQGGQQEEGRRSLQGQGGQQEEGRRSLQGQGGQQEEGRRSLQGQGGQQEEGRRSLQGQGGQQEEGRRSLQGQGGQQEEGRRSLQGQGGQQEEGRRSLQGQGGQQLLFEVTDACVVQDGTSKYVLYTIHVIQSGSSDRTPAVISRRYSDFQRLHARLRRRHGDEMQRVCFPRKKLRRNFAAETIAKRSQAFEQYLSHLSALPGLRGAPFLREFLYLGDLQTGQGLIRVGQHQEALGPLLNARRLQEKLGQPASHWLLPGQPASHWLFTLLGLVCCFQAVEQLEEATAHCELALQELAPPTEGEGAWPGKKLHPLLVPVLQTTVRLSWKLCRDKRRWEDLLRRLQEGGVTLDPAGQPSLQEYLVKESLVETDQDP